MGLSPATAVPIHVRRPVVPKLPGNTLPAHRAERTLVVAAESAAQTPTRTKPSTATATPTTTATALVAHNSAPFPHKDNREHVVHDQAVHARAAPMLRPSVVKAQCQLEATQQQTQHQDVSFAVPLRKSKTKKGLPSYYDHLTLQRCVTKSTGVATRTAIISPQEDDEELLGGWWNIPKDDQRPQVFVQQSLQNNCGALFVPGRTSDEWKAETGDNPTPEALSRRKREMQLVKEALNRGQPVLAVCAGSWRLAECLAATGNPEMRYTEKSLLMDVEGHTAAQMISVSKQSHRQIIYKEDRHQVILDPQLRSMMSVSTRSIAPQKLAVNSVHWKAVNLSPGSVLSKMKLDILAECPPGQPKVNVRGSEKTPSYCVEAFGTRFGAPTVGIQWHPEANCDQTPEKNWNARLIAWFYKAGKAYLSRRRMVAQFTRISSLLNHA
eukprot:TRINITY_DN5902_c0_g3_i1.p1 TRINITY_DN5902_c0_g3~~TRINITY_DN5902_c0_g3_i1.p1  ORF type:complete len:439 (-),score=32.38 TRINITY_DN5902_c0_g3_i1:626-1942(-)